MKFDPSIHTSSMINLLSRCGIEGIDPLATFAMAGADDEERLSVAEYTVRITGFQRDAYVELKILNLKTEVEHSVRVGIIEYNNLEIEWPLHPGMMERLDSVHMGTVLARLAEQTDILIPLSLLAGYGVYYTNDPVTKVHHDHHLPYVVMVPRHASDERGLSARPFNIYLKGVAK